MSTDAEELKVLGSSSGLRNEHKLRLRNEIKLCLL